MPSVAAAVANTSLDAWFEHAANSGKVYHSSNLHHARPFARHAVVLSGALRTFETCLPSLERTVLLPNAPVDVFFWLTISERGPAALDDVSVVRRRVLTMPRHNVHLEQWGPGTVAHMSSLYPEVGQFCSLSQSKCDHVRTAGSSKPLNMLSSWRKKSLAWAAVSHFVASTRQGAWYASVFYARPDLVYPIEPLDLDLVARVSEQHHAALLPAAAEFDNGQVFNDQIVLGTAAAVASYMDGFQLCMKNPMQLPLNSARMHPCATTLPGRDAIAAANFQLRRFWWQYWILRPENVVYYNTYPLTFHHSWFSTACWQTPMWFFPARDFSAFIHLNTTCTCNVETLSNRRPGVTLAELKHVCHYTHDYCGKRSGHTPCNMEKPPAMHQEPSWTLWTFLLKTFV